MAVKKNTEVVEIRPIEIAKADIMITGDSPLIVHKWSEKAKRQMLDKQMKVTKTKGREAKNPIEDFVSSMYWIHNEPDEYTEEAFEAAIAAGAKFGFPVNAIKQAAISGAYRCGAIKDKVSVKGAFFIEGVQVKENQLAIINGSAPVMREDMVRVGMGTADIRYRGEFREWSMPLFITYNKNGQYTLEQIINLINMGGYTVGIGEWRPEKDGQYGMFHVAAD